MVEMMVLSPEQLNKIWERWRDEKVELGSPNMGYVQRQYSKDYTKMIRNFGYPKQFEEWLWEHGGIVQQVNHKRQILFTDESRAIMFALQYL
jgi:hypothetical protein